MPADVSELAFGCYPEPLSVTVGDIQIQTLPDPEQKVARVAASGLIDDDWLYAPARKYKPYAARVSCSTSEAACMREWLLDVQPL